MTHPDAATVGEFTCPNCGATGQGVACHSCGQKRVLPDDLSLAHVAHEVFEELTHLDGRLLSSLRLLLLRPGQLTLDYLEGRRKRHVHPMRLFLVIAAIAFFSLRHAGFTLQGMVARSGPPLRVTLIEPAARKAGVDWKTFVEQREGRFQSVYQSGEMAADVVVIGLFLWLLFRKRYPYLGQHMVMALHFSCIHWAVNTVAHLVEGPVWLQTAAPIAVNAAKYVYLLVAVRRVYREGWPASVVKSLAAFAGLFLAAMIAYLVALFAAIAI